MAGPGEYDIEGTTRHGVDVATGTDFARGAVRASIIGKDEGAPGPGTYEVRRNALCGSTSTMTAVTTIATANLCCITATVDAAAPGERHMFVGVYITGVEV